MTIAAPIASVEPAPMAVSIVAASKLSKLCATAAQAVEAIIMTELIRKIGRFP